MFWILSVTVLALGSASDSFAATTADEEQMLTAPSANRSINDFFGDSVAISHDGATALVGVGLDNTASGEDVGSVYVFVRSGTSWTQQQQLFAGDPAANDIFGSSVALSADGNTALVGSPQEDPAAGVDAGSAYVFTRSGTTWTQQAKLNGAETGGASGFGSAVDLSDDGNLAVVGASGIFGAGLSGSAYVFRRSGGSWTQEDQLLASDGAANDQFGAAVSISGDGTTVLVGAYLDDESAVNNKGSVYAFTASGGVWSQEQKIEDGTSPGGAWFGESLDVSTDGNVALIGKQYGITGGSVGSGTALVYTRSGAVWSQEARLEPPLPAASDWFGCDVELAGDGNVAVIGVQQLDTAGNDSGGVMVFSRSGTTWSHEVTYTASDAVGVENLGVSVAYAEGTKRILAGASNDVVDGLSSQGSAYVHVLTASEPEIGLFAGAATTAPEVLDGQAGVTEFGFSGVGSPVTRDFTIENTGSADLTVTGITPPAGFEVLNAPSGAIAAAGTHTFQVRLASVMAGPFNGIVTVVSNDADEGSFEFPVAGTVLPADYHGWATGHGLSGPNLDPLAIPGIDGVENLLKFAFNLDPTSVDLRVLEPGSGLEGLPVFSCSGSGASSLFRIEFIRRIGTSYIYSPVQGTTLSSWDPFTGTPVVTPIDATWERVVIEEPFDGDVVNAMFGRVGVAAP